MYIPVSYVPRVEYVFPVMIAGITPFKHGTRSASPGEALLIPCMNDGKNCLSMPSLFVGLELIWCYISRFLEERTGR